MAILHGWHIVGGWLRQRQEVHPEADDFRQQLRDLYIPPSDTGFWQAGIRSPDDPYRPMVEAALAGEEEGSRSSSSTETTREDSGRSAVSACAPTTRRAAGTAR